MENKIVVFANQKGGVGKTSLAISLAHWLTLGNIPVLFVDADLQQSAATLRQEDSENFSTSEPWKIYPLDITSKEEVKSMLTKLKNLPGTVIIDSPGSLDNDNVKYIFNAADVIVIPIEYSRVAIDSTAKFAEVLKKMKDAGFLHGKVYYLPNKFDERSKKVDRSEIVNRLENIIGIVGTRVNERAAIKNELTTYSFPSSVKGCFKYAYAALTSEIYGKSVNLYNI